MTTSPAVVSPPKHNIRDEHPNCDKLGLKKITVPVIAAVIVVEVGIAQRHEPVELSNVGDQSIAKSAPPGLRVWLGDRPDCADPLALMVG